MTFDLHFENFNSAHNFLTIRHRAFIFGMCVPYDKTFLMAFHITRGFDIQYRATCASPLPFTPYYFAIIHIKYHIAMSPLAAHAFLGMPYIFFKCGLL